MTMQRSAHRQIFKHSAIAVAVGLASMATIERAAAFTVFETPESRFVVNGRIAGIYNWNDEGSNNDEFSNASSRINLVYEHTFTEDWKALARTEWGFDPFFEHGSDNHNKRLLYAGLSNPTYGTITVGKQWSVIYDLVDAFTDQAWWYSNMGAQSGTAAAGEWSGLTRPDQSIRYVVDVGDWTLAAMYGTSRGDQNSELVGLADNDALVYGTRGAERTYFAQTAFNYRVGHDVTLFGGYNYSRVNAADYTPATDGSGNIIQGESEPNINNWELGANWAPNNWYLSALGGESRNLVESDGATWRHAEAFAGYTIPAGLGELGDLQLYSVYNYASDKDSSTRLDRKVLGVAAITFNETLIVALEHVWVDDKLNDGNNAADHDITGLLVRYNY